MDPQLRNLCYLLSAALFIFGIKGLTHPRTAVRGNLLGALGMLMAIVVTLVDRQIISWAWIIAGLVLGSGFGAVLAVRIRMTAMPQLVGFFNGFGGLASFLVAGASLHESLHKLDAIGAAGTAVTLDVLQGGFVVDPGGAASISTRVLVAVAASGIIGAVTFSGSLVAVAKLQDYAWIDKAVVKAQKLLNLAMFSGSVALGAWLVTSDGVPWIYWLLVLVALGLGVFVVSPIGGADMPVVISLLNSYSGLAAAATGFVINNTVLIIAGSLVGASGLILTHIMCVAMNRSLTNVLFGVMADVDQAPTADEVYAGKVKSTSPEEVAMLLETARKVCIVPGYGMAVAQAQHAVHDVASWLEGNGCTVEYGIHPVAGRMPGHMNVLLAEADVPYDQLKEMDEVNSGMSQVDVAIVLGANDTVNPVARDDPSSPIAGMPIIEVDRARTVVVVKRSLSPGYAGIPNPLFAAENSVMFFSDGKKAMLDLLAALKE